MLSRHGRPCQPRRTPPSAIICFTTGGTIASTHHEASSGLRATIPGRSVVAAAASGPRLADVELATVEFARQPSSSVEPAQALRWAHEVAAALEHDETAGAVVTLGTNTMEEVAYLFDLVVQSPKPVVLTGAMRPPDAADSDAVGNLEDAVLVAASPYATTLGTVVVMEGEIHAAVDVTKVRGEGHAAFRSPVAGPIGVVAAARRTGVMIHRRPVRGEAIPAARLEPRVGLVKAVMGADSLLIDALVQAGARGVIVEGFAGGDVASGMASGIERAVAAGVIVVVSARHPQGATMVAYSARGEGGWLARQGVLFADYLSGPKARIKLMLALGHLSPGELGRVFP
jgi:L-asparaginase